MGILSGEMMARTRRLTSKTCAVTLLIASLLMTVFSASGQKRWPSWYNSLTFEKVYGDTVPAPPPDLTVDVTDKSLAEIRLLRNGIYARHGHLFNNSQLRGYFSQYDWYQPVYWDSTFGITLSDNEQRFVDKVLREEKKRKALQFRDVGGLQLANTANIVNTFQFDDLPPELYYALARSSFAIYPAKSRRMYHVYDQNSYTGIPNFVTTDSYLQLLHVYFQNLLKTVENEQFVPLLNDLLVDLYLTSLNSYLQPNVDPDLTEALAFNVIYLAVAANLSGDYVEVPSILQDRFDAEFSKANATSGIGSALLDDRYFSFEELTPRGHYVASEPSNQSKYFAEYYEKQRKRAEQLSNYFKTVKWLNTAPIFTDDDTRLRSAIELAHSLRGDSELRAEYRRYISALSFFAGESDNLTVLDLIELIDEYEEQRGKLPSLAAVRKDLSNRDQVRIGGISSLPALQEHFDRSRLLFLPSFYSFDANVLHDLVNITLDDTRRSPPKGLDVFAAFGDSTATHILLDEYGEARRWPGYGKNLLSLQSDMSSLFDSTGSTYGLRLDLCRDVTRTDPTYPEFMRTDAWGRKELNTALAGWTELKHDMVLYMKKVQTAEGGDGAGPPPAVIPGYVEPHVEFWQSALDLLDHQEAVFAEMGVHHSVYARLATRLRGMAQNMLEISEKELIGELLTDIDFKRIERVGPAMEHLTREFSRINHTDEIEPMPLAVDVYANDLEGQLIEAVGHADHLYAVVEINGLLYLARGPVFSYYEFLNGSLVTDQQWRERIYAEDLPPRPSWMKPILLEGPHPVPKPGFGIESYGYRN
jgi:Protein of unknown function (DUF3160)/YARHG domain